MDYWKTRSNGFNGGINTNSPLLLREVKTSFSMLPASLAIHQSILVRHLYCIFLKCIKFTMRSWDENGEREKNYVNKWNISSNALPRKLWGFYFCHAGIYISEKTNKHFFLCNNGEMEEKRDIVYSCRLFSPTLYDCLILFLQMTNKSSPQLYNKN